jgi:drug/metabolite transporter (DMT)-like permease
LLLSGIAGVTVFAESHFWQWWIGIALIFLGVSITAAVHDQRQQTENKKLK